MNLVSCKRKTQYLIKSILIIYVFCLVYSPRLIVYNTLHILFALSLLITPLIFKQFIKIAKNAITVKFCIVYFCLIFCSTVIAALGEERLTITNFVVVPIELGTCVLALLSVMRWQKMGSRDLIQIIIIAGIIQSLICCAMVFSSEFRIVINEFRSQYWDDRMNGWATIRLLGFADGLFHTTPIIQAIISILIIKKAEQNPLYLVFAVTTLISAILNSRTSFIVWIICFIVYLFLNSESKKRKRNNIILLVGCLSLLPIMIFALLGEYASGAVEYFYSGMDEISSASQGKNEGFFSLLSKYLVFPSGIFFLLGVGTDTYGKLNNPDFRGIHTDYGFVNDIWIYGIVGATVMVILYFKTILNCLRLKNVYAKLITYCLIIAFVLGHFKGIITYYNDFTAFLLLVSSSTVLDNPFKGTDQIKSPLINHEV